MERNTQKNGMVNMLGLLVACVVAAVIGKIAHSATSAVGAVFLGTGFLVAAISYFQMRLENREQLEKMEFEEIAKDRNRSALFEESGEERAQLFGGRLQPVIVLEDVQVEQHLDVAPLDRLDYLLLYRNRLYQKFRLLVWW